MRSTQERHRRKRQRGLVAMIVAVATSLTLVTPAHAQPTHTGTIQLDRAMQVALAAKADQLLPTQLVRHDDQGQLTVGVATPTGERVSERSIMLADADDTVALARLEYATEQRRREQRTAAAIEARAAGLEKIAEEEAAARAAELQAAEEAAREAAEKAAAEEAARKAAEEAAAEQAAAEAAAAQAAAEQEAAAEQAAAEQAAAEQAAAEQAAVEAAEQAADEAAAADESQDDPPVQPAAAPSRSHWDELADCESGNWVNGGASFETGSARWDWAKPGTSLPSWGTSIHHGGLQFHPGTWDAYRLDGYPARAYDATREQQIEVGKRVQAAQGWQAWPTCARKIGLL